MRKGFLFLACLIFALALFSVGVTLVGASASDVEDVVIYAVPEPEEGEITRWYDAELDVYCWQTALGGIDCISVCDLGCTLECEECEECEECDPCETPTPPPPCYQWLIHKPGTPAEQLYCCDSDSCVRGHLFGGHESDGDFCTEPINSDVCRQ